MGNSTALFMPHAIGPSLRPDPTQKITDCDGLEERRAVLATALPLTTDPTYAVAAIAPLIIMEAVLAASIIVLVERWL